MNSKSITTIGLLELGTLIYGIFFAGTVWRISARAYEEGLLWKEVVPWGFIAARIFMHWGFLLGAFILWWVAWAASSQRKKRPMMVWLAHGPGVGVHWESCLTQGNHV